MQGCNFRCIPAYQIDMRIPSFLGAARALALSLVLLGAPIIVAAQTDSTKATAPRALRELLADASKRNVLPPSLISFRSNVETEISVLLRREEGNEAVAAVEQVASTLKWNRTGFYDQRIVGYRGDFRLAADNIGSTVNLQVEYFIRASGGAIAASLAVLAVGAPGYAKYGWNDDTVPLSTRFWPLTVVPTRSVMASS